MRVVLAWFLEDEHYSHRSAPQYRPPMATLARGALHGSCLAPVHHRLCTPPLTPSKEKPWTPKQPERSEPKFTLFLLSQRHLIHQSPSTARAQTRPDQTHQCFLVGQAKSRMTSSFFRLSCHFESNGHRMSVSSSRRSKIHFTTHFEDVARLVKGRDS